MERLVYAVFDDHDTAQRAIDALLEHGVPEEVVDLALHEGHVEPADLPAPALRSRRLGLTGGAAAAAVGAVVGILVTGSGYGAGIGLLMGGMLGFLFAALFGHVEPKPEVVTLAQRVEHGRVLVTVDATSELAGLDLERFFGDRGAREVGMT
ncbi:hypothetical protein [Paraliomyxa miuraensis]|uniref:hypothetical protein n=1 Tax=Paraliomyxa miuraensis TaxID=376150 RepID=UPI0022540247|nr:hypothetical protein [Paraliomyxa miuraensis]MCX4247895.1 hypothetical protein [Paraliomyxa miuraensis]